MMDAHFWMLIKEEGWGKLTQFDIAIHRQKDIIRLDITVDYTFRVEVLQTIQSLIIECNR